MPTIWLVPPMEIKTYTDAELAEPQTLKQAPSGAQPGVPYLIIRVPYQGVRLAMALPLTELRDALAALPGPERPTTVAAWNERALARRQAAKENVGITGLKCTACGGVLVDTEPNCVFACSPPKKRLDCRDCQNIEYVYV